MKKINDLLGNEKIPGLKKLLRHMKLTVFFILISLGCVLAGKTYSQTKTLTLHMENSTVKEVLAEIESQSEFRIMYSGKFVDVDREVSLDVKSQKIESVLNTLFVGTDVSYTVKDRFIVLITPELMYEGTLAVMQQRVVSGKVTDSDGQPLPGVNVVVKGTTQGTVTNADGEFTLTNIAEDATLVFSFVGMKTQEVTIRGQNTFTIVMEEETVGVEEVVAVGYGTQKKVNLTGAIATTSGEVLENRPITNALEGLQGVVAGLNITNANGEPGSNLKFNIRGATSISGGSPLVLVDGTQMDINLLDPADIENISVLKDPASAAIYGARAAYGVILVTTKSGKRNTRTKINYRSNFSASRPTILPNQTDSYKYALFNNAMRANNNQSLKYNQEHLALIKSTVDGTGTPGIYWTKKSPDFDVYYDHANTNWADLVFANAALGQNHNISISGGTEKTGFYTSFGYTDFYGIVKIGGDNYRRYNMNIKLDNDVTKWLTTYFQVNFTKNKSDIFNLGPGLGDNIFHATWRAYPTQTPTFVTDNGVEYFVAASTNPIALLKEGGRKVSSSYNINTKAGLEMTFGKLKIYSNFTYNPYFSDLVKNNRVITSYSPAALTHIKEFSKPSYLIEQSKLDNYYAFDAYAQYETTFAEKHNLKLMAGYNQEWKILTYLHASNDYLISQDILSLSASLGIPSVENNYDNWALQSGFSRLNYIYSGKYLLEVNGRYDGSSRFKKGDRFGFFPSVSGGWRISEEPFMSNARFVDNLKLRASYGSLGNQSTNILYPVDTYKTISEVGFIFGGARPVGVEIGNPLGDHRTWETVSSIDLGLDVTLFKGLDFTFDGFKRTTKNMLVSGNALPGVYGAAAPQINAADLEVKGWDASLGWRGSINNSLKYYIMVVASDSKGMITKFDNPTKSLEKPYYVGHVIGEIWGYETVGLFQSQEEIDVAADHAPLGGGSLVAPGDVHYADLNDDEKIDIGSNTVDDPGDRKVIGNRTPRYNYSIRGGMEWNGFDANFFLQGIGKRDYWLTGPIMFGSLPGGLYNTVVTDEVYDKMWSDGSIMPENLDAYYFRASEKTVYTRNTQVQTRYLQNAAYLRLKNVTVGYTLPKSLIQKIGLYQCRLFISGENLLTFTKLSPNFDPEVLIPDEASQGTVQNFADEITLMAGKAYPLSKRLSLGINVSF